MTDITKRLAEAWANVPTQYKPPWAYEYDSKRGEFIVTANGHVVCSAEDSEVAHAICLARTAAQEANVQGGECPISLCNYCGGDFWKCPQCGRELLSPLDWRAHLDAVMAEIAEHNDISVTKIGKRPAWIAATNARMKTPT